MLILFCPHCALHVCPLWTNNWIVKHNLLGISLTGLVGVDLKNNFCPFLCRPVGRKPVSAVIRLWTQHTESTFSIWTSVHHDFNWNWTKMDIELFVQSWINPVLNASSKAGMISTNIRTFCDHKIWQTTLQHYAHRHLTHLQVADWAIELDPYIKYVWQTEIRNLKENIRSNRPYSLHFSDR